MSFCRIFGFGLKPYLNVSSECNIMKRVFEVKYVPSLWHNIRAQSSNFINKEDEVVYVGPLSKQIRSVKVFSLLTSCTGVLGQPIIYEQAQKIGASTPMLIAVCSFVGFFTFVTPFLLHFITKKYVTSVVYDSRNDLYTATIYSILVRKKEVSFRPGEAIVPDILGMFTSMTVRGIPLFIDARFFNDTFHYKRIMGYDKPIDFKIPKQENQDTTNSQ